jgi:glycosyltransferase involved in cell wall biosynthesis
VELDRRIDFDVVHHVTLAAYWMRTGVVGVRKPLVWGPVGGGVEPPWRLAGELGVRGMVESGVRTVVRRTASRLLSPPVARGAAVVFAQNEVTASRMRAGTDIIVLPNGIATEIGAMPPAGPRNLEIMFVGRLAPWKGGRLAVRTMRYVSDPRAILRIHGRGAEQRRMLKAAQAWGVEDRVSFEGTVPHREVLARVAQAGVLLHPGLHEESPIAVAEALSMGTPVVCLDHGGPTELIRQWPESPSAAIPPGSPTATARALAEAVDLFLAHPPPVPPIPIAPKDSFGDRILEAYERAAALPRT